MENKKTFSEALKLKYSSDRFTEECQQLSFIILPSKTGPMLNQRTSLTLDGCHINSCGEGSEIKNLCPLVKDLDLSSNYLQDWRQVFGIIEQLGHLDFLNLSHNNLADSEVPPHHNNLPKLQRLALNNTGSDFNTVVKVLKLFPSLKELHSSLNEFGDVPENNATFENVETLYLAKNRINDWSNVQKLGRFFPRLRNLILSENEIPNIHDNENISDFFPCLEKLNIAETQISQWECLDKLRTFPALYDVRMQGLPLWENHQDDKERLELIIARLPNLRTINGAAIQDSEREDAERVFLRFYKKQDQKPKRYQELVNVHGVLDDLVDIDLSGTSQKNDLPLERFTFSGRELMVLKRTLERNTETIRKAYAEAQCVVKIPKL